MPEHSWDGRPMAHEWDRFADPDDFSALCLMLHGSDDSWTGDFLRLCAKSDPEHLTALRRAAPGMVAAWQMWTVRADGTGRGVREAHDAWRVAARNGF